MKKLRLLLSFVLLCVGANVAWSDDYTVVNLIRYRLNHTNHTAAIVQSAAANADNYYWRADGNFIGWSEETAIIPESILYGGTSYSVTRLEEFNFSRCTVTMYLPKTVRYIGRIHCEKPIICEDITYLHGYRGKINLFITGDWPDINLGECNASNAYNSEGTSEFSIYLSCYDYNSFTLNPNTHEGTTPCGTHYSSARIYPWVYSAEGTGSSSHALPNYAQRGSDFKYFNHIEISSSAGGTVVSDPKTWPLSVFSIGSNGGSATIEYNEKWWMPFRILPNPGYYPIVKLAGQRINDVYLTSSDYYEVETPPSLNNSLYEISYVPKQTNVTVTSNGGKAVKVRTYSSNGDEICNTIGAEGGNNTQEYNFIRNKDNLIELEINYDPSEYDVNLTYSDSKGSSANWSLTNKNDGTKVYGIEYAKGNNVQIDVQFTPKSKLCKFNFINFGEGTVDFYGKVNGSTTHYGYRGYYSTSPSFDYDSPIKIEVTPPTGLEVKSINAYPYISKSEWVVDEAGVVTVNDWFLMKDATNRLEVKYGPIDVPEGTQFNVHLAVEGAQGSSYINIGDGDNGWKDYSIDNNDIPYSEMIAGEMFDVIGAHAQNQYVDFYAIYDYVELQAEGIVNSVKVYANGELIEAAETGTEFGDHYLIPLDGCDMDIRVVFESNGRQLTGNNGNGGILAIYKEGTETAVKTYPSGRFIWTTLPKDNTYYAVVTPNTGKDVTAILRGGNLLPSPSTFRQSDGTYRIPLENFANGDTDYQMTISYGDAPYYTFNISVVGDGSLKCIPFREEDGNIQAIREVTAFGSEGCNRIAKAYYNEIGETGYVEFYASVPKEGETLKVYMDGVDVTNKFTLMANMNNQYLRGVISSNPTEAQLGALNSVSLLAVYEENKDEITWKASMVGNTSIFESADIVVAGGDAEIDLRSTMHDGTTAFNMAEIGTNLVVGITAEAGKQVRMLFNGEDYTNLFSVTTEKGRDYYIFEGDDFTQFFVDGNWVFSYTKKEGTTWTAQLTGEVGNGAFNFGGHDLHFALNADNPLDTFVDSDTEDPTITSGAVFNGVLTVPTGYTFNILFNGLNLSSHFEYGNTENGLDTYYAELECTGTELSKLLTNGFWTIEIMKKKITWTAKVTGAINEQTYIGSLIDGGDVLDMDFDGLETTQESATFTPGDISAGQWAVWIIVKPGQKVRLLFNGDDVSDLLTEHGPSNGRVEYGITNSTADLNQFLVDGTWLFEVKDPEITWTSVASGDAQYWISIQSEWDGDPVITELDSKNNVWMSTGVVDSNHCNNNFVYLLVEPGYSFKASFNGTDITNAFTPEGSENGMIKHVATKNALDQSLLATDGVWTFEFTKNGVTWSAVAAGDVVGGNRLNALTFESELEVDVNKNQLFDSMTYEGDDRTLALNTYIYVRNNSHFQVWFNGVECTDKFTESETLSDGTCKWAFNSTDPTVVAPYAVDGTWVVIFYDDKAKYDVNGDGTISIADVTKLVNVILGKE